MISQLGKQFSEKELPAQYREGWEVLTSQLLELWKSPGLSGGCWAPQGQKYW